MNQFSGPKDRCSVLARLYGLYHGIESSGDGKQITGIYDNKLILGGFFAELNYSQQTSLKIVYSMRAVVGWSTERECYFLNWYDSMGGSGTGIYGDFCSDTLTLEGPDSAQGGYTRFIWEFSANSHTVGIESSPDGQHWQQALKTMYELQQ